MRKLATFGVIAFSAVLLAGCYGGNDDQTGDSGSSSGGENSQAGVFNVIVPQEIPSADLSQATDTISFTALNNVYEGIYRLDGNSEPKPAGAAEMAKVSEDGLTYTIKLRDDAVWSNGDPVTAEDYVYGWQRTVRPETASQYAYLYEPVENAAAITSGEQEPDTLGITAVNEHELEIKLAKPTPYFQYLLAFPSFFPQKQEVVEEYGDAYATNSDNAVYNGPFTLEDFDGPGTDTEWTYKKNEDYWDSDAVELSAINVSVVKEASTALNLFNDGQADDVILTGELAQQNANDPNYQSFKEATTSYLELNQRDADSPFRNENLRKAIAYAINREALVTQILGDGSVAATNLVPSELSKNPETDEDFVKEAGEQIAYDPEQAKEFWDKAKEELNIDTLNMSILSSDTDSSRRAVEYLQNSIQENLEGVTVSPTPVPFSVRLDRSISGDFDLVLGGWGADYADPSSFTDLFTSDNSQNNGRWSNSDYDKAVEESATTNANDEEARWKNLQDANRIIADDAGIIPIYQKAEGHLISDQMEGIIHHAAGAAWDYKWASKK
ncbi:peptide ABC transporter substrate-binding protein [Enterococcus florum]|uniref:Peptide ABC transporter substrate-binding protein n=1 Tax=Enterococcus florum TaxID=2480627 RepID=A0A4P5PBM5_9ENTE|nr:peptide ABC transporter substrate-binding protein [Enterococcus florum]GCF95577.1 peptide ABC transporter substrate-binding protein [Enterococcus florum]